MAQHIAQVYEELLNHYGDQNWWPGETEFEIMVGAILTQNTAWSNVEKAISKLRSAGLLDPKTMLELPLDQLASTIRSSGYYNIKARRLRSLCQLLQDNGGIDQLKSRSTKELRTALLSINGIGPETADDILLYAFNRQVFVIDAYTRRIFTRLGLISGNESYEDLRHLFESALSPDSMVYAQYHALIVIHAKAHCLKRPLCAACPLAGSCVYLNKL